MSSLLKFNGLSNRVRCYVSDLLKSISREPKLT